VLFGRADGQPVNVTVSRTQQLSKDIFSSKWVEENAEKMQPKILRMAGCHATGATQDDKLLILSASVDRACPRGKSR
jgi:hypothetical protein